MQTVITYSVLEGNRNALGRFHVSVFRAF